MEKIISSGIDELDQLIGGFFPGDNVVWQTDDLKEFSRFAKGFAKRAIADGLHYSHPEARTTPWNCPLPPIPQLSQRR